MTQQQVQQAVETLEAQGKTVSVRTVVKLLRQIPPRYMGGSFRDLLPILRKQAVPSEIEQARRDLNAMAEVCEAAVRSGVSYATRQKLITDSGALWVRAMGVLRGASARGEDVTALVDAFERLRVARGALLVAQSQVSR